MPQKTDHQFHYRCIHCRKLNTADRESIAKTLGSIQLICIFCSGTNIIRIDQIHQDIQ